MKNRKHASELISEISKAKEIVKIGGKYSHYKDSNKTYTVIDFGVQEATNKICVMYKADYVENLIFVRDLDIWLEKVEVNSKKVNRFTFIN